MFTSTTSASVSSLQAQLAEMEMELALAHKYIELMELENSQLKAEVEELSVNPNFGCKTRVAGLMSAEKAIKQERRKNPSSQLALVTVDIGGMGNSNSSRGEVATNLAMTALLEDIRISFRAGDISLLVDSQLNSGDEFLFWVKADVEDLPGIMSRLDSLSTKHGFEGAYCGSVQVVGCLTREELVDLANEGMEQVYPIKKARKAEKAAKLVKSTQVTKPPAKVKFFSLVKDFFGMEETKEECLVRVKREKYEALLKGEEYCLDADDYRKINNL